MLLHFFVHNHMLRKKLTVIFSAQILLDAIGYMGLFTLFMALDDGKGICVENLQVKNMPELSWGDTENR